MTKILIGNLSGPVSTVPGPKGDTGNGLIVLDVLDEEADLPPTANPGDGYVIDGDLWTWAGSSFVNIGPFRGEAIELRDNAGWVEMKYPSDVDWTQLYEIPVDSGGGASTFGELTGEPTDNAELSEALGAKANASATVNLTGTQSIEGAKSFVEPLGVPAPVLSGHAARKADVDTRAARTTTVADPTDDEPALVIDIHDDGTPTGSWKNRLEIFYRAVGALVSVLVTWINEYGELRGMPAKSNTVAARWFMAKDDTGYAARSATVPTLEVADKRDGVRATKFGVYKDATRINGYLESASPTPPASPEYGQIHTLTEV